MRPVDGKKNQISANKAALAKQPSTLPIMDLLNWIINLHLPEF
jgi:hypothetical protein